MEIDPFAGGERNRRRPRVLIVDDDPAALKFLTDRCQKMGVAVQTASYGLQALSMARQTRPDVLIVDVHLPDLDGLSLCSRLLDPNQPGIDVIVVSGYSDVKSSDRCQNLGAHFVPKGPALWASVESSLHEMFPGMSVEVAREAPQPDAKLRERPLILVIDDDPHVGRFLGTRLRKCGVDVIFATDGRQGYDVAAREKPSVILSEYFMPVAHHQFPALAAAQHARAGEDSGAGDERQDARQDDGRKPDEGRFRPAAASSGSSGSRSTSTSCSPRSRSIARSTTQRYDVAQVVAGELTMSASSASHPPAHRRRRPEHHPVPVPSVRAARLRGGERDGRARRGS